MIHTEGELRLPKGSAAAGAQLFTQSWQAEQNEKAVILLVHGYAEHSGRYTHVAEHCVAHGYSVHALDHWGHGRSEGEPGYVPEFSVFVDGVLTFLDQLKAGSAANKPLFLVGHSMGGLIACHVLLRAQAAFAGAVLSGAAIRTAVPLSPFMLKMSATVSKLLPKMAVMSLSSEGVSRDPDVVKAYDADPLVYHGQVRARLGHELVTAGTAVEQRAGEISLPILILHGDTDKLAAADGSQYLHDNIASKDKKLILYPGLYHEIFNEPEQEQVLTDMTDWLDAHR